ncbi:MAG: aminopeptidase, partial [Desulfovibrionaceae bacterium]|nr:aminopeptidase [Desulfovibrionaceae bacterium]
MDKSLQYNPESSWKQYDNPQDQEEISAVVGRYLDFLSTCKTEREVINYVEARLREAGYTDDLSQGLWVRPFREKALFAFKRGTEPLEKGLSLIAAHTDSPRLDLKQHPFLEQADVAQAETHYYGGIKKYQWLSRPLALHGVVLRENGERVDLKVGEKEDDPVFCIADLLPHLGHRELEKTVKEAFDGEKMKILLGHKVHKEEEEQDKSKELGPLKGYLLAI